MIIKQNIIYLIAIFLCSTFAYSQVPTEDPPQIEIHPMLASVIEAGPYKAQWKSLIKHPMPKWFTDAKVGISAHWGPYAVPGWTPRKDTPYGVAYSEWYWEWLKTNKAVKKYHKENYGNAHYDDFIDGTKNLVTGKTEGFFAEKFNANEWMKILKESGVKYFFITSKHHDGFCIFDSKYTNRNSKKMGARRNLYAEIVTAARKYGIKIGLYYSFYEWNNPIYTKKGNPKSYKGLKALEDEDKDGKYNEYVDDFMIPQIKELIDEYQPDYLCFDGEWDYPYPHWRSRQIIAYYYNQAASRGQEVVVNDRFGQKKGGFSDTRGVYGDFSHIEYHATVDIDSTKTWVMWRGFGNSFGYNKNEHPDNLLSPREVIHTIVNCVSHNGNIEFNIGPKSDGTFSKPDIDRLKVMEKWLKINGEAIYGTYVMKPYQEKTIFFTQKKDAVYAIYLADSNEETIPEKIFVTSFLPNKNVEITLLGSNKKLKWKKIDTGFVIEIPKILQKKPPSRYAWTIKIPK